MRTLLIIGKSVFSNKDNVDISLYLYRTDNVGNFLYFYSLEKYLYNGTESFTVKDKTYLKNYNIINNDYDLIVFATDNILNAGRTDVLREYTRLFSKINIPIYMINIGLQADINDTNVTYIETIKTDISNFLESVYKTGGSFALRGFYTAKIFDKLGFSNYTVTGCPTFFINGSNGIKLNKNNKLKKVAINGTKIFKDKYINRNFTKYDCCFFDQDRFYKLLFEKNKYPLEFFPPCFMLRYNKLTWDFYKQNRIKLFQDIPLWRKYLQENCFDFSFGTRIHGNIISLLSGIPSMVYCKDLRTLELAEYFEIPHITKINKKMDLQELYNVCDYTKMLSNYDKKLDIMQNFFDKHKIPAKIKCENDLFEEKVNEFFFLRV